MTKAEASILPPTRLEELEKYQILDTIDEREYDDITKIAAQICHTPISLVSLVSDDRQWFKSRVGLTTKETPRRDSFCYHAIEQAGETLIIEDSRNDKRFFNNPLVTDDPFVVFYAGVPLVAPGGFILGTLCVIDHKPRSLDKAQVEALESLANQVVCLLELRKSRSTLTRLNLDLEKKNLALEQFAFIAAHDIKSPLNSISSTINFMMADESLRLTEGAKSAIAPIDKSARQLRRLVDGILEYSRSDKVLKQQKELFNIQNLIENIIHLFDARKVHNFIYPKGEQVVYANKTALKQIFINLISNSLKYSDKAQAVIEMGLSESTDKYHFYIKDNGAGIRKSDHDKIFEIFEISAIYGKKELSTSGIGLATVKKLVNGLGGNVSVQSKIGEGACFSFSLDK